MEERKLFMQKYLNQILCGDCIEIMRNIPDASIDAIFADSPYNLQLGQKHYTDPKIKQPPVRFVIIGITLNPMPNTMNLHVIG